ncbi:MAG: tetratricopeptide repeat protein [Tannerella sp.]|jgi:tetratricopeptide (TPR) repeat protein|nr:tetratricopeptide repeat protein [Tannerella sp.]
MRITFIFVLTTFLLTTISAQKKAPKWLEKVNKAIITIETTTKEGTSRNGNGFFIHENGEAVSSYDLFRNAEKAVVTTMDGEKLQVVRILGADDLYGVIRFKVSIKKKTPFLTVVNTDPPLNATAFIPPSKEEKEWSQGAISEITKVKGTYNYYKIEKPLPASQESFPLLNENGEVFALTQADASGKGKTYGLSVEYIKSLNVASMDMLKRTYSEIGIRKAWGSSAEEAQISLLLYASQQDAPTYLETLNDFISTFPNAAEGYVSRASHYAYHRKELASAENEQLQMLDRAWEDLDKAGKQTKNKADAYYNKAKLIFGVITNDTTLRYKEWNMAVASDYIRKAIAENDLPAYRHLEGDVAFYNQEYENAYHSYSIINQSPSASASSWYLAAKSKEQIPGSNPIEIITMMDSAVAKSPANEATAYLLESIDLKMQTGLYDQAVKDYDTYYRLAGGNVNDGFYYFREQAKFRSNDLEGALKDVDMAIAGNPTNAIYHAEKASVYLRLKDPEKAQASAEKAIELQPDFASAYRILGICLIRREKKTEACPYLEKAKELGDPVVDKLITEHCGES